MSHHNNQYCDYNDGGTGVARQQRPVSQGLAAGTSVNFQNDALCCSVGKPAAASRPASATRTGAPVKIETQATLSFLGRLLRLFAAESHSSTDNQQITSQWEI